MGTKNNPGEFDCYAAAGPDEEMFILLARDEQAPQRVRDWADERERELLHETPVTESDCERRARRLRKVAEARACADRMEQQYQQSSLSGINRRTQVGPLDV